MRTRSHLKLPIKIGKAANQNVTQPKAIHEG